MIAKIDDLLARLTASRANLASMSSEQLEALEGLVTDNRDNYSDQVIEDEDLCLADMLLKVEVLSPTCVRVDDIYAWVQSDGQWVSPDDMSDDEIDLLIPAHVSATWR